MEIARKLINVLIIFLLVSCACNQHPAQHITDLHIDDFQTEDINTCKPSDVDLSSKEAEQFFLRSKKVSYKIIHDHYNIAPCHIEGTLKTQGKVCEWKIQASLIGSIKCDEEISYYACDSCEELFN